MDYLENYKKMISLRGLTDHTMTSYCTYVTAYLDFVANTLHVQPSEVGYPDIIRFLDSLKEERGLSDRTINGAISQIRFFTIYVLHTICPVTGRDQTVHLDHDGHQAEGYGRPYVFLRPADR